MSNTDEKPSHILWRISNDVRVFFIATTGCPAICKN